MAHSASRFFTKLCLALVATSLTFASSAQAAVYFDCNKGGSSSGQWRAESGPSSSTPIRIDFCGQSYYIDEWTRVNLLDRYCLGGNGVIWNEQVNTVLCRW